METTPRFGSRVVEEVVRDLGLGSQDARDPRHRICQRRESQPGRHRPAPSAGGSPGPLLARPAPAHAARARSLVGGCRRKVLGAASAPAPWQSRSIHRDGRGRRSLAGLRVVSSSRRSLRAAWWTSPRCRSIPCRAPRAPPCVRVIAKSSWACCPLGRLHVTSPPCPPSPRRDRPGERTFPCGRPCNHYLRRRLVEFLPHR